jgi:hypothetical protein
MWVVFLCGTIQMLFQLFDGVQVLLFSAKALDDLHWRARRKQQGVASTLLTNVVIGGRP